MQVLVDTNYLKKQIRICDIYAQKTSNEEERELFYGIANFLDNIDYAIEKGAEINIIKE